MHSALTLSLVAGCLTLGAARVVAPPETWDTLSVSCYDQDLDLFVSTKDYSCEPSTVSVRGTNPPFHVVAITAPYTSQTLSNQTILSDLGNYTTTAFSWDVNLSAGQTIALRVQDEADGVAYSADMFLVEGNANAEVCRHVLSKLHPTAELHAYQSFMLQPC
ncbi:hypothetical protein JCM5296_000430 [Sporobolomyces johnsonii]